jgi:hypothetical protein
VISSMTQSQARTPTKIGWLTFGERPASSRADRVPALELVQLQPMPAKPPATLPFSRRWNCNRRRRRTAIRRASDSPCCDDTSFCPLDTVVNQGDAYATTSPTRGDGFRRAAVLTRELVAMVVEVPTGGVGSIVVEAPNDVLWSIAIRPLLPNEIPADPPLQ